jgi:PEP-CTERM/exosortase A-associated glycosyltransferase
MRILHVLDHSLPLHSGYTFRTLSILREQRALGWETFHLTSEKQENCTVSEETVDGWHFYRTAPSRDWLARLPVLGQVALMRNLERRLDEVVRKVRPDILHAHSPSLNALPALRVGRRHNIPVVYEVRAFWEDAAVDHGTIREGSWRYRLTKAIDTYLFKRVDAVTTICAGLLEDIVSRGIPRGKVTVIPNAVDATKFSAGGKPDPLLQEKFGISGKKVLGFAGSFYAYEGLDLLLEAMPEILRHRRDTVLLLIGGGFQEDALKAQAQRLGISDKVIFTGRVPHQDVTRYYDLIDVLVYPRHSMRLTEIVTPLKPLEAMAQGKLLLASDVGGHRELIRHMDTGVLFAAGDKDDLASKALGLLEAPALVEKAMVTAGRRFVEEDRTWTNSVDHYKQVYGFLLADKYFV